MRYVIESKGDELSIKIKELIISLCDSYKYLYLENIDNNVPFICFSIGGDGTFLRSVKKYKDYNPLFITINTGNFGYLCEFKIEEIKDIFNLLNNKYNHKELSLLRLDINKNSELNTYYALNEFRISSNNEATIKFDIYINDTFLETLKGDGCVISSSIGSSGIAKSLGGALVDNEIEMLEFIENAPISNKGYHSLSSPFVLNKYKKFKLTNFKSNSFNIYYDAETILINDFLFSDELIISLDLNKKIKILINPKKNYINKTKDMFID